MQDGRSALQRRRQRAASHEALTFCHEDKFFEFNPENPFPSRRGPLHVVESFACETITGLVLPCRSPIPIRSHSWPVDSFMWWGARGGREIQSASFVGRGGGKEEVQFGPLATCSGDVILAPNNTQPSTQKTVDREIFQKLKKKSTNATQPSWYKKLCYVLFLRGGRGVTATVTWHGDDESGGLSFDLQSIASIDFLLKLCCEVMKKNPTLDERVFLFKKRPSSSSFIHLHAFFKWWCSSILLGLINSFTDIWFWMKSQGGCSLILGRRRGGGVLLYKNDEDCCWREKGPWERLPQSPTHPSPIPPPSFLKGNDVLRNSVKVVRPLSIHLIFIIGRCFQRLKSRFVFSRHRWLNSFSSS